MLSGRQQSSPHLAQDRARAHNADRDSPWVVLDGRIDNVNELRRLLTRCGHAFQSDSDSELLVRLYLEYGVDLVDAIDGDFAFVLYDPKRSRLIGARDPLGAKPLYYALSPQRFAFASEPKALLCFPDVSRAPNLDELPSYLAFACLPGPPTLYRDIQKLAPGTRFEISGRGEFASDRYWSVPPSASGSGKLADFEGDLERVFARVIRKRCDAQRGVGVALSGGVDSSLLVAYMVEMLDSPLATFTIGYPGDERAPNSDRSHARALARQLGTDHHELVLDRAGFARAFEELPCLADDPNGSASVLPLLHLARCARDLGVEVLQTGDGADGVFFDAVSSRALRWEGWLAGFEGWLPAGSLALFARRMGDPLEWLLERLPPLGPFDADTIEVLRRFTRSELIYWGHGPGFHSRHRKRLLGGRNGTEPHCRLANRVNEEGSSGNRPSIDRLALSNLLLHLPERVLMRADRTAMHYGIEPRFPFIDPELLRQVFAIPAGLRGIAPKHILQAHARRRLPASITRRKKVGLPTARRVFLAPEPFGRIRDSVLDPVFLDLTGLSVEPVKAFVERAERMRPYSLAPTWSLYMLSLWARHWL